ncbi:MAG: hypothetical protein WCI76_00210 [bacterium]
MDKFIDVIKSHYEMALKSGTGLPFYSDVNHYLFYIIKTPKLYAIITDEYAKLKNELKEIKENPFLSSSAEEDILDQTKKISLYTDYIVLYKAIYLPFQANDNESILSEENSKALFYLGGIEKVPEKERSFWQDSFASHFERNKKHFTNLHFKLLEILETKNKELVVKNKDFDFDVNTGQFRYFKTKGTFSPKKKEFKFLKTLYFKNSHQATYAELSDVDQASRNDKIKLTETVRNVKTKLGILSKTKHKNKDIIKTVSGYGYELDI